MPKEDAENRNDAVGDPAGPGASESSEDSSMKLEAMLQGPPDVQIFSESAKSRGQDREDVIRIIETIVGSGDSERNESSE